MTMTKTPTWHHRITTIRTCHHCGRTSSSLLRCARCQSAYYCNRSCQSAAWWGEPSAVGNHDRGGHRSVCRRLAAGDVTGVNDDCNDTDNADAASEAMEAWRDLARRVESMDRDEAYMQMCKAQDEIRRLQSHYQETKQADNDSSTVKSPMIMSHSTNSEAENERSAEGGLSKDVFTSATNSDVQSLQTANEQSTTAFQTDKRVHCINGTWIDNGGECSVEFLPNVKCYILTLIQNDTSANTSCSCIPTRDEVTLDFSLIHDNSKDDSSSDISYYEVKMYHNKVISNNPQLLSLSLPVDSFSFGMDQEQAPNYRVTTDDNSLSVRIQFHSLTIDGSNSIIDELLGNTDSTSNFSSTIMSDAKSMNYLCCRTCHNPIVENDGEPIIQSVLPLPSGYWDEITDFLICYDGQPTVDFNSSLTNAIRGSVLEDDAILILHQLDLRKEGGVCELNVHGYGEKSSKDTNISNDINSAETGNTQPWKDKSWRVDTHVKSIACAICCSTLGFVSSHDTNTYRFYKHLLGCFPNNINANPKSDILFRHTCGSFLSREMIRYAESDAIYTFIVETEAHTSRCILLRMLSWDTIMGTTAALETKLNDNHVSTMEYQKVLKVLFEETSNVNNVSHASDNPMEWKWGGLDLCCPPLQRTGLNEPILHDNTSAEMTANNVDAQTKITSVRIYLSSREYHELKQSLVRGSHLFSEAVRDAFVTSKLGVSPDDEEWGHSALLSFLPIIGS